MCIGSSEPGGPRRCSGDARSALQRSSAEVATCEAIVASAGSLDWRPDGPGSAEDLNMAYRADVKISPVLAAVRFARTVLQPGRAVIVDTETVSMGGSVCEIGVIDAHSGQVLLNTLVNPGTPIVPAAQAVHGISDDEVTVAGVPTWKALYPLFEQTVQDRVILAYNADYDRAVIARDCERHGIISSHLCTHRLRWSDVLMPRTHYAQSPKWMRNGGGHRALGDAEVTRQHLLAMASGEALRTIDPPATMSPADLEAFIDDAMRWSA